MREYQASWHIKKCWTLLDVKYWNWVGIWPEVVILWACLDFFQGGFQNFAINVKNLWNISLKTAMVVIPSVRHNHHSKHWNFELFINYLIKAAENTHCASSSAGVNQCKFSVSYMKPTKSTRSHFTDISAVQICLFYRDKILAKWNVCTECKARDEVLCCGFSSPFSHHHLEHNEEGLKPHCGADLSPLMQGAGDHMFLATPGFDRSLHTAGSEKPQVLGNSTFSLPSVLPSIRGTLSFTWALYISKHKPSK